MKKLLLILILFLMAPSVWALTTPKDNDSITCPTQTMPPGLTPANGSGVATGAPEHGNTLAILGGGMLGLAAFRRKSCA